jgi:hypothetical protein
MSYCRHMLAIDCVRFTLSLFRIIFHCILLWLVAASIDSTIIVRSSLSSVFLEKKEGP